MTLLKSPVQISLPDPRSLSPSSDALHSLPLTLAVALNSSLLGLAPATEVLMLSPVPPRLALDSDPATLPAVVVPAAPADAPGSAEPLPPNPSSPTDVGKKLGLRVPSIPRPPPAAMAVALKTAAALRLSRRPWRRSTTASRRPSMRYGRAIWSRLHNVTGVQSGELGGGRLDV